MDHQPRILLLENIPDDAELIELHLRKSGLRAAEKRVASKEYFLKALQEFSPDVIISSFSIPRFDGISALKMAGEITPGVPWVIVSSEPGEENAVECMKLGAVDYVSKRNLGRLVPAVKRALEKKLTPLAETKPPAASERPPEQPQPPAPGAMPDSFYRLIADSIDDFIAVVDLHGRRIYNSPSYARVLEDPDVLVGTDSFVDIHPEDRPRIKRVFEDTVRTGIGHQTEYRLMDKDGNTRYIESRGTMIKDPAGKPQYVVIVSRDVTDRKLAEITFQSLVGATAGTTGNRFFEALAEYLAVAAGVRFSLVSRCVDPRRDRVRALAYWADGKLEQPFEYDVVDTTCEKVVKEGKLCYYPDRLQELFPKETALVAMKARSYLGAPLLNASGVPVGHLFIMDQKPIADPVRAQYLIKTFASRAAVELTRHKPED